MDGRPRYYHQGGVFGGRPEPGREQGQGVGGGQRSGGCQPFFASLDCLGEEKKEKNFFVRSSVRPFLAQSRS